MDQQNSLYKSVFFFFFSYANLTLYVVVLAVLCLNLNISAGNESGGTILNSGLCYIKLRVEISKV